MAYPSKAFPQQLKSKTQQIVLPEQIVLALHTSVIRHDDNVCNNLSLSELRYRGNNTTTLLASLKAAVPVINLQTHFVVNLPSDRN